MPMLEAQPKIEANQGYTGVNLLKLIWILLLSAPVAALIAQILVKVLPSSLQMNIAKALLWASIVWLVAMGLAGCTGVRFVPILANIWALAIAYFAYCFLAFATGWLPWHRTARLTTLAVATLPIAYGYFMGTVGLLALTFEADRYIDPPLQTVGLDANTVCIMTNAEGWLDTVHLLRVHKEWQLAPILHRQTQVIPVTTEQPSAGPTDCEALRGRPL